MQKENKGDIRVYLLDKPSFLSCGRAYITDTRNKILLIDDSHGTDAVLRLKFQVSRDMPYTLAPYPLADHVWDALLMKGTRAYPSCDVDCPGGYDPKSGEIPTVIGTLSIARDGLDRIMKDYAAASSAYRQNIAAALRAVDDRYRKQKEALDRKIKLAKAKARQANDAPDLVSMILGE